MLGRQGQEDPWGSLTGLSNLLVPGQLGTLSQRSRWTIDIWLAQVRSCHTHAIRVHPTVHPHRHKHVHACIPCKGVRQIGSYGETGFMEITEQNVVVSKVLGGVGDGTELGVTGTHRKGLEK